MDHYPGLTSVVTGFFYGNPGDVPFMGDWDGEGIATPGLFRTSDTFAQCWAEGQREWCRDSDSSVDWDS